MSDIFKFKKFSIRQDRCAMKVGVDSVLLGAWADVSGCQSVLDVGTGTGLLSLMVAQRCGASYICGIELDPDAVKQAEENVVQSPWEKRIHIECCDVRQYQDERKFDLVISNPPYFSPSPFLKKNSARSLARETQSLSYAELLSVAASRLRDGGKFAVVLPASSDQDFVYKAWEKSLYLKRKTLVYTKAGKVPKRVLMEFVLRDKNFLSETDNLYLLDEKGNKTEEYRSLTEDFYL